MENVSQKNKKESTVSLRVGGEKSVQPKVATPPEGDTLPVPKTVEDIFRLQEAGKITGEEAKAMFEKEFPVKDTGRSNVDAGADKKGTENFRGGIPLPKVVQSRRLEVPVREKIWSRELLTALEGYLSFLKVYHNEEEVPNERVNSLNKVKELLKKSSVKDLEDLQSFLIPYQRIAEESWDSSEKSQQTLTKLIANELKEKLRPE